MVQLFLCYGAMSSGKTIETLKVARNYQMQGQKIALVTSGKDDRSGKGIIASRVGLNSKTTPVEDDMNILNYVKKQNERDIANGDGATACVLTDEAQFLYKYHVLECAEIVDKLYIPVMAFGLKNDFQDNLFEGSRYLLLYADKIEEMEAICHYCGRKATMVIRVQDDKAIYEGAQLQVGGDESYYPACCFHYNHPSQKRKD